MALAGELAKYIGNEMIQTGGKELAKAGAKSVLSSLVPSVATKVGTDMATKAGTATLGRLVPKMATPSFDDNTMDLIETLRGAGANVDDNGSVSLYHRTTPENAREIYRTGKMFGKENDGGIFFSTNKDFQPDYGSAVVEAKIPANKIQLDDIFDNNADVKYVVGRPNQMEDMSEYLVRRMSIPVEKVESDGVPSEIEMAIKNSGVDSDVAKRAGNYLAPTTEPSPGMKNKSRKMDGNIKRIGSSGVAPINPDTLPPSLRAAKDYLDEGVFVKDIEKFAGKPYSTLADKDFLDYSVSLRNPQDEDTFREVVKGMVDDGATTYRNFAASAARNARLNKIRQGDYQDIDVDSFINYLANHRSQLSNNTSKSIDNELSDRLGIGRSNTFMRDNQVLPDALGVYSPTSTSLSIRTDVPEEEAVSTLAHERMHSFQAESKIKRYDKRVVDAYDELSKELDKHLRSREEIAKMYKTDIDYWASKDEQESRMLQSYLENEGFTKTGRKPEWGKEIKPAFDKFYKKLRSLSKAGVALPAFALMFGLDTNSGDENIDNIK